MCPCLCSQRLRRQMRARPRRRAAASIGIFSLRFCILRANLAKIFLFWGAGDANFVAQRPPVAAHLFQQAGAVLRESLQVGPAPAASGHGCGCCLRAVLCLVCTCPLGHLYAALSVAARSRLGSRSPPVPYRRGVGGVRLRCFPGGEAQPFPAFPRPSSRRMGARCAENR